MQMGPRQVKKEEAANIIKNDNNANIKRIWIKKCKNQKDFVDVFTELKSESVRDFHVSKVKS